MTIFIDTGFYLALIDKKDAYYERAPLILEELQEGKYGALFTSNYVLAESATLVAARTNRYRPAMQGIFQLFMGEEQLATIIRPSETAETKARDLFLKINSMEVEKPVSFVDCLNIVICQQLHVPAIVTFDERHYKAFLRCIN